MSWLNDILKEVFNFTRGNFDLGPKDDEVNSKYPVRELDPKLKDVLGHLRRDLDIKSQRLRLALGAPFLVMTGGGESLQFAGQYGGGAPTSDYVAPDRLSEAVYSTARILARVLKTHEKSITQALSTGVAKEIEQKLKDLHEKEQELFSAVYTLGEVANLSSKDVKGLGVFNTNNTNREALLKKIRDIHEAAEKDRKAIFVALGMP